MSTASLDRFGRQIAELQDRVGALQQRATDTPTPDITEALGELSVSLEELRVAQEELRVVQEELSHQSELLANAEAEALRDRRRYLDLFEQAPDGYLVTTRTGLITEANQAAAAMLNRPAKFLTHKPIYIYLNSTAASTWGVQLLKLGSLDGPVTFAESLRPRGKPPLEVEFTVAPGLDPLTGRVTELRWQLHDIGPRLQAERELNESRQMHDELGGGLTAIKLALAQARHRLGAGNTAGTLESTDEASHMTDDLMGQVRHIASELRPALLDELGLAAAVEWLLQDFQKRSGIDTRLVVAGKSECPPGTATVVFRVLQELLTNVARHAQAEHVRVRLSQARSGLTLEVRDDGRGITEADTRRSSALGILGMRERLDPLGGTLSLGGCDPHGTVAVVSVPVTPKA